MDILNKDEVVIEKENLYHKLDEGNLFIHPTDTIYGLGCDATNQRASKNLRKIKGHTRPMSVIAPSKEWILENCEVSKENKKWIDKLPGAYTLILPLKNKNAVAKDVILDSNSLGVRIPNHWISAFTNEFGKPILTTSANKHGESYINKINDLNKDIKKEIEFAIDEGVIDGTPSTIINLTKEKTKIIKRK